MRIRIRIQTHVRMHIEMQEGCAWTHDYVPHCYDASQELYFDHLGSHLRCDVQVRPKYGVLLPGESAELRITIMVNDNAARALARGERELEDVLILHVEGGNDTFISVTGSYLASCYGASLQSLLALTTPARYSEKLTSEVLNLHLPPIPREVWRLCGAILDKGMDEEKIFFICGDEAEVCRPCSPPLLVNLLSEQLRRISRCALFSL